jgi:beta-lactamase class A
MTKTSSLTKSSLIFFVLFTAVDSLFAQTSTLKKELEDISRTLQADVGVAVVDLQSRDTFSINGNKHFPMQSVFKFHLALAALRLVDEGKLSLDQKYMVTKDHYFKTWSVLMRDHPEANVEVTLRELITWTVMNSDNVACDLVFEILGGPDKVNKFIKTLGITDVAIVATERKMHQDWNVQFSNWTTPRATAALLKLFDEGKILKPGSNAFLWKLMVDTPNAPNRLKGMLPEGTVVARKPGTGDTNGDVFSAVNDVGILVLPNGKKIIVATFVTRAKEELKTVEEGIAKMSRVIYDHFNNRQNLATCYSP